VTVSEKSGRPVERLVLEEAREMRAFVCLLEEESEALRSGTDDQLLSIASSKSLFCDRLQELSVRRATAVAAEVSGMGHEALSLWLAQLPAGTPLKSAWAELMALTTRALALNDANGALIRARIGHGRRALAILLDRTDSSGVYGPDGQARIGGTRRELGVV
jgi:flagellar biosynthesis/type III secretory pathway chaperone